MMAVSPSKYADRVLACTVYCDGKPLGGSWEFVSARIRLELNRIGKATLHFNAGDMDRQSFDETDSDLFRPGGSIRVDAGELNDQKTLFEGIILETGIKIGKGHRSMMTVECRDCAWPATQGRKNRVFEKKKDSEMIAEVLSACGNVSAESTDYRHPEMVQYYCTDWDFALSRADACGMFILATGNKIAVFKPRVSAPPVLTVTYGNDLIGFEGGLSAGEQFAGYDAVSWNPAAQKAVRSSASTPVLNRQGDLAPKSLAGKKNLLLQTDAPTDDRALKAWVDSMALKAGLARYRGSFRFYGAAEVVPGCLIELKGLGKRFNGEVFVGSVTHIIEGNEWITETGIGVQTGNMTAAPDVTGPPASGFLPGVEGLHTAVVRKLNDDPAREYRLQVELPWMEAGNKLLWARLSTLYAGDGVGSFFLPEVNDEVLLGFVNGDPGHPVVVGSLYGDKHKPPFEYGARNDRKAIVTRSKLTVEFDEQKKILALHTPDKNRIEISDEGKSITLSDQNGNKIVMDGSGISLASAKDITLKAKGNIVVDAAAKTSVSAKSDVSVEGLNVKITGRIGAACKGGATAELSASGQTIVKGAMVMIN
jgi:Rhs element Vgr protein